MEEPGSSTGSVSDNGRRGRFGGFGGQFVPETLMPALQELEREYLRLRDDPAFNRRLGRYLRDYVGRPTPLYFAENFTEELGGARIYLKREDLCHTGAHKINNTVAQCLLASEMGKSRVIAETGAGQHGVATATAAALFDLECTVYMGEVDIERQRMNAFRMKLLGAQLIPVSSGSRTLKDAINEALRDWVATVQHTHYCIGSVVGPHPYPSMVRDFQCVIGRETRGQLFDKEGRNPDLLVACVGGGSNSLGLFHPFMGTGVEMVGVEAGGVGDGPGQHGSTLCLGEVGVLHGATSYLLQDEDGQIVETHSVSAGLDYPGVGPEHSYFKEKGLVSYTSVSDREALRATELLSRTEGIIPALESAHAVAYAVEQAPVRDADELIVICLSGRGDKDMEVIMEEMEYEGVGDE